jgi:hypothetical protein
MATFTLESNGMLDKTAVYYNGQQLGGIKEVYLNMDEEGTFDAVIQYEGTDKQLYTKDIFKDYLTNVRVTEPSFTEEEGQELQLLEIESSGDIESSSVFFNGDPLEGIVELFIHIKGSKNKTGLRSLFSARREIPEEMEFKAEITFRNEDDSIETEAIF